MARFFFASLGAFASLAGTLAPLAAAFLEAFCARAGFLAAAGAAGAASSAAASGAGAGDATAASWGLACFCACAATSGGTSSGQTMPRPLSPTRAKMEGHGIWQWNGERLKLSVQESP